MLAAALLAGCSAGIDSDTAAPAALFSLSPQVEASAPPAPPRRQGPLLEPQRARALDPILSTSRVSGWAAKSVNLGGASPASDRDVVLNLVDAPIRIAAETVLGSLFSGNIIVDPGLTGTVTITSPEPVSPKTAVETFELALAQNGARLIHHGTSMEVVRTDGAAGSDGFGASRGGPVSPGYSVRVVPLKFIGAKEMATILKPMAGEHLLAVDATRNLLVLAGNSSDHRAWRQTVESFDVNWLSDRAVGLFPIVGRSAGLLVGTLERYVASSGPEETEPLAYFEVIPENNAILAVARSHEALVSVAEMIDRVTASTENDTQLFVYDMRYGKASEIAATLSEVFDAELKVGESVTTTATLSPGSDDAAASGTGATLTSRQEATVPNSGIRIVHNEATNTLLIRATPRVWPEIVTVIEQIDVPQRQVLVEATIIEVTLNDALRYGVQYFLEFGGGDGAGSALLSAAGSAIAPQLPGGALSLFGSPSVVIDALDDVTQINVISSPNMMVLNNQSARLIVGEQVPVATRQAEDVGDDNEIFASTVEFRDTGIIFEVTPRITSTGSVEIAVRQEVSTVSAASAETLTPTISQRVLQSAVSVETGETIILGGLFSDRATSGRSGIPGLVDVPGIGALFGRTNQNFSRTELVVLLTPKIVSNSLDARNLTQKMRARMTSFGRSQAILSTATPFPGMATPISATMR